MEDNSTIHMEVDCPESSKDNFQLLVSLLVSQWKENVYASKYCETHSLLNKLEFDQYMIIHARNYTKQGVDITVNLNV
jgi:hypothetical protein